MPNKPMPWIDVYDEKEWEVHRFPWDSKQMPATEEPATPYLVCGAESPMAENHWRHAQSVEGLFLYDLEQIAAGTELAGGRGPKVLTEDWQGHPKGSLVFESYAGVLDREYVIMVEKAS
jgi:hypothetical protein